MAGSSQTLAVRAGGIDLNVQLTGDGPVVVLLHGFPDSLHMWRAVVPHLVAAGYRVVAIDQRGCGNSPTPGGRAAYGIDRLLDDVTGVLDTLGLEEPVHVMGHDWGAVVTWCLAMTQPQRVRSAVDDLGRPPAGVRTGRPRAEAQGTLHAGLAGAGARRAAADGQRLGTDAPLAARPSRRRRLPARPRAARAADGRAQLVSRQPDPGALAPVAGLPGADARLLEQRGPLPRRGPDGQLWTAHGGVVALRAHRGCRHWLPLEQPERVARLAVEWFGK